MSESTPTTWGSIRRYTLADDLIATWGSDRFAGRMRQALLAAAAERDRAGYIPTHEQPVAERPPVTPWPWGAKPTAMQLFDLREQMRRAAEVEFAQRGGR
jgi:hypothetical protein